MTSVLLFIHSERQTFILSSSLMTPYFFIHPPLLTSCRRSRSSSSYLDNSIIIIHPLNSISAASSLSLSQRVLFINQSQKNKSKKRNKKRSSVLLYFFDKKHFDLFVPPSNAVIFQNAFVIPPSLSRVSVSLCVAFWGVQKGGQKKEERSKHKDVPLFWCFLFHWMSRFILACFFPCIFVSKTFN